MEFERIIYNSFTKSVIFRYFSIILNKKANVTCFNFVHVHQTKNVNKSAILNNWSNAYIYTQ